MDDEPTLLFEGQAAEVEGQKRIGKLQPAHQKQYDHGIPPFDEKSRLIGLPRVSRAH